MQNCLTKRAYTPRERKPIKVRLGMTLIETTVVMIIASAALAAGASMYFDYLNGVTNKSAAHQMKEVSDAFSRYMDDNHMALRAMVPGAGSRATIPFNNLKAGNYLPAEFDNKTPFNHEYVLTIRRPGSGDVLQGLVHTRYTNSNFAIKPKDALMISRLMGASAGYTNDSNPQVVNSTYGNYNLNLSAFGVNPGAGVLVSAINVEHATKPGEKYLHRSETGDPDHNRMNTSIDMNNNNLNDVNTLNSRTINNSNLTTTNELRSNTTEAGTLSSQTATVRGHLQTATARVTGRLQSNSVQVDGGPVTPSAGQISASSMHSSDWFRSHGQTGWYSQTYGGGWHMTDTNWIRAYNNKNVYTPGEVQSGTARANNVIGGVVRSGQLYMDGGATFTSDGTMHIQAGNGTLHLNPWSGKTYIGSQGLETSQLMVTHNVSIGGACSGGQFARSGSSSLGCVDGRWKKMGGGKLTDMDSCTAYEHGIGNVTYGSGQRRTSQDNCTRYLCIGGTEIVTSSSSPLGGHYGCSGGHGN